MNANEYQNIAVQFATGGGKTLAYALMGLVEEVGELIERTDIADRAECSESIHAFIELSKKIGEEAKYIRKNWQYINGYRKDDYLDVKATDKALSECGDVLWMVANVCHHLGAGLNSVMLCNIAKLDERLKTNTICGSGETVEERIANAKKGGD